MAVYKHKETGAVIITDSLLVGDWELLEADKKETLEVDKKETKKPK